MMNPALAQLRAKTDRELGVLIRRELERATKEAIRGHSINAENRLARAEAWLQVAGLTTAERTRLERSIQSVRESIKIPAAACA